jgi:hypothetical protein
MLEVVEHFECVAVRLSPIVLVLPGLVLAVLGLFVWLGGLGFRRVLMGIVGTLFGGLGAFSLAKGNLIATVSAAMAWAFIGVIFQRFFAVVLLGLIGAVGAFLVLAWPAPGAEPAMFSVGQAPEGQALAAGESLEIVESHWLDLEEKVREAGREMVKARWALVALAALVMLGLGIALRRFGVALACATVGTVLVFVGLVLLLMFKGSEPVTYIESRPAFFGIVFACMVAFGTLEQFVLCRRAERREAKARAPKDDEHESKRGWRDR